MVSVWPIICLILEPFGLLNCDDPSIVQLRANTFDAFISDNEFVMVKFYTPWCQHCKNFRPEYSKLSRLLQMMDSKIKLAKVNVADDERLGEQNGIRSYPTLKLFINGKPLEYRGKRTAEIINLWLSRKIDPIQILDSLDDIEMFVEDAEIAVIGFFIDPNSGQAAVFKNAVCLDDTNIQFAIATMFELKTEYKIENNQVTLFKEFDDKTTTFDGEFSVENLNNFFVTASKPLLIDFKMEAAAELFQNSDRNYLFVFTSKTDQLYRDIEDDLCGLARKWRRTFFFIIMNMDYKENFRVSNLFGVDPGELPTYRIVKFDGAITKYKPLDLKLTIDGVAHFIQEFVDGGVAPDLLSQELPSDWNANPVKVLVSSNFDEIVFDVHKDVLVAFYSPRCGHCKSMEKDYNKLGEFYKDSKTVVIAKIDATQNELGHTKIRSFPTIKLYRRGDDNEVKDYQGSRTLDNFIAFIEEIQITNKTFANDEL